MYVLKGTSTVLKSKKSVFYFFFKCQLRTAASKPWKTICCNVILVDRLKEMANSCLHKE